MQDRNVQWPNRYQLTKVEGTDDIYDLTPAPGTITEEGTMINKASLLTDETAQAYGFTEEELADVVPDDVLAEIKALITLTQETADAKGTVASGSYIGTGTSGSSSPNTLQFPKPPKFVVVTPSNRGAGTNISLFLVRESQLPSMTNSTSDAQLSSFWSGNSVSWYNRITTSNGVEYQLNINGTTYYYVGLY